MTTVTKFKFDVSNPYLPFLRDDGSIVSFYLGNYTTKLADLGYTLPEAKEEIIDAFINKGIEKGWIAYLYYFLPIVGTSSALKTGAVPLIDTVGNYAMAEYSNDYDFSNYFALDTNNNIVGFLINDNNRLRTPVKWEDMDESLSVLTHYKWVEGDDIYRSPANIYDAEGTYAKVRLRFGTSVTLMTREHSEADPSYTTTRPNTGMVADSIENNYGFVMYHSLFVDKADEDRMKLSRMYLQDNDGTLSNKTKSYYESITVNSGSFGDNAGKVICGHSSASADTTSYLKCFGLMNPSIPEMLLGELLKDVNELDIALGK